MASPAPWPVSAPRNTASTSLAARAPVAHSARSHPNPNPHRNPNPNPNPNPKPSPNPKDESQNRFFKDTPIWVKSTSRRETFGSSQLFRVILGPFLAESLGHVKFFKRILGV